MALNGTLHHRKTRRLAAALGIDGCFALGILEALWHLTFAQCPRGDIGRLSNQDIAEEILYSGDADKLIQALLDSGWLDTSSQCRLSVHDWLDHASWGVKRKLTRRKFAAKDERPLDRPLSADAPPDEEVRQNATISSVGSEVTHHSTPKTPKPPTEGDGDGDGEIGGCRGEPQQPSLWPAPVPQEKPPKRPLSPPAIPPWRIAKVIEDHRDRLVGAHNPEEKWDNIFQSQLGITYGEAMEIRSRRAARGP